MVLSLRKAVILGSMVTISTAGWLLVVSRLFPIRGGFVGSDDRYVFPYLLAGYEWVTQNGLFAIPYFTPDFCGGIPWLANPISFFYSLPQLLTLILADPVAATSWSLTLFSLIGSASTYVLLRRCFGTSWQAAGLGFVLFQLNGFLLFRAAIGHIIFAVIGLVPALCLCALAPQATRRPASRLGALCAAAAGGLLLAAMVYGGAPNYVMPAVLDAAAVILLSQARSGFARLPWLILAGSCLWSIAVSALKLLPASLFALRYPRESIGTYFFDDPFVLARTLLESLFVPDWQPYFTITKTAVTSRLGVHELDYGVSLVPPVLLVTWLAWRFRPRRLPRHRLAWTGFVAVCAIPILVTFGSDDWAARLHHIPIVNNNTVLTRWWSIYILLLIVAAALAFDRLARGERARELALGVCVCAATAQLVLRDLTFYTTDIGYTLYDPRPVADAMRRIRADRSWLPTIGAVGPAADPADLPAGVTHGKNDGLLQGVSSLPCYEPIFGYDLQNFPAVGLAKAKLDRAPPGLINLADPRCYLSPGRSGCRPGALFSAADAPAAQAFASHRPLPWDKPSWLVAAWAMTVASLGLTLGLFAAALLAALGAALGAARPGAARHGAAGPRDNAG